MNEEKFLNLQLQMKQNNEDYKDFIDGIESWSSEMKEKRGKNVKIDSINNNNNFPIRNSVIKLKKNKKNKISAFDYEAWDKFDVEKALKSDDEVDYVEENREILAKEHREVGNLRFKEGNYAEATAEYSKAINYNDGDDVLYTNRAMSLLKMGSYEAAEVDCCRAIELEHSSVKAYYRRARCRVMLQRREEAVEDLRVVLQLDPGNKLAKNELRELEKELNIRGVVEPLYGAPKKDKESSKPLLKINIVDVNPDKSISDMIKSQVIVKTMVTDKITHNLTNKTETKKELPINVPSGHNEERIASLSEPRTWSQLVKDLNKYRKNELSRAEYVSNIDHRNYRKLIGHSLDCKLINDFINGLSFSLKSSIISPEDFVIDVNHLTEVERFNSLWLMMSDEEKRDFNIAVASLDEKSLSLLKIV